MVIMRREREIYCVKTARIILFSGELTTAMYGFISFVSFIFEIEIAWKIEIKLKSYIQSGQWTVESYGGKSSRWTVTNVMWFICNSLWKCTKYMIRYKNMQNSFLGSYWVKKNYELFIYRTRYISSNLKFALVDLKVSKMCMWFEWYTTQKKRYINICLIKNNLINSITLIIKLILY